MRNGTSICPTCEQRGVYVVDVRTIGGQTFRKRLCGSKECKAQWITVERPVTASTIAAASVDCREVATRPKKRKDSDSDEEAGQWVDTLVELNQELVNFTGFPDMIAKQIELIRLWLEEREA